METYKDESEFIIHLSGDFHINEYKETAVYISFVKGRVDKVWVGEEERDFIESIYILGKKKK